MKDGSLTVQMTPFMVNSIVDAVFLLPVTLLELVKTLFPVQCLKNE